MAIREEALYECYDGGGALLCGVLEGSSECHGQDGELVCMRNSDEACVVVGSDKMPCLFSKTTSDDDSGLDSDVSTTDEPSQGN